MKVIKRDGRKANFNIDKIKTAIKEASNSIEDKDKQISDEKLEKVLELIQSKVNGLEEIEAEELLNIVQNALMNKNCYDVATEFIKYSENRNRIRLHKTQLIKNVNEKLTASNVQNQNANVDEYSFGGRKAEAGREIMREIALNELISEKFVKHHNNNEIYIHDLDSYSVGQHNCLTIPFDELLKNGFKTRQVFIRPAGSVNTALQLIAVIFQIQSLQQFGGVSSSHLDFTLVPYVRKSFFKHFKDGLKYVEGKHLFKNSKKILDAIKKDDIKEVSIEDKRYKSFKKAYNYAIDMTKKEIFQGVEGLLHNCNSLNGRSSELPFTSLNYGTCTLMEGRMITEAVLQNSLKGVGNGQTSIFPCGIFQYKKGVNDKPGTPNYDLFKLALKSTSKRMYPNYCNADWSSQKEWLKGDRDMKRSVLSNLDIDTYRKLLEVVKENPKLLTKLSLKWDNNSLIIDPEENPQEILSSMGCRTMNGRDINFTETDYLNNIKEAIETKDIKDGKSLSSVAKDGRGNIAPATIILPTLAMQAKKRAERLHTDIVEEFMKILDKAINDTKDELLERYNWICSQNVAAGRFMYENHTMFGYDDSGNIESAIKHGTLAIGQLGLTETLRILINCDHTTEKGMKLAKRIEQLYKDKCNEFKKKYSKNFGVYYSPCENTSYTAMKKFKAKYGIIQGVSDKDYFINSMHVDVKKEISPFEKIDIESQLTGFSSAGCITYVEIGDKGYDNLDALEQLVNYAMNKDIPYFALNARLADCDCGYSGYIPYDENCPVCGADRSHIQDYARITGYLSTSTKFWNLGKQAEAKDRFIHVNKLKDWKK